MCQHFWSIPEKIALVDCHGGGTVRKNLLEVLYKVRYAGFKVWRLDIL